MQRTKRPSFKKRLSQRLKRLAPLIKALRPSLKDDMHFILNLADGGARVRDWLERNKSKAPRQSSPKSMSTSRSTSKKKDGPSHQLRDPGPIERRRKKWTNPGLPNNLDHIPPEDRDLARLELLRACHEGPEAFVSKREELMKRFKIHQHPRREFIMGAFWGHLNGHRRSKFVERVLAMSALKGAKRNLLLADIAKLYRVSPKKLTLEVDAQPTVH